MILKYSQRTIFLLSFIFLLCISLQAQVTIGSADNANEGSLLDLKEENVLGANSSKGLLLPRVKLLDHEKLQPMYSYTEGNTPTLAELSAHEGLVVYNTNGCAPFGLGTYVWIGNKWVNISEINSIPLPSETINIDTLHILVVWMRGDHLLRHYHFSGQENLQCLEYLARLQREACPDRLNLHRLAV